MDRGDTSKHQRQQEEVPHPGAKPEEDRMAEEELHVGSVTPQDYPDRNELAPAPGAGPHR